MSDYSELDITANGIQIHYYRSTPPGGAPPVVILHGLSDSGLCWARVANTLRNQYDIILPDTRGHGHSEKPISGYGIDQRAADVAALIDALGLDRPVLIGHSLGGETASAVAAFYPERVRALVLEDPAWMPNDSEPEQAKQAENWVVGLRRDKSLGREGLAAHIRATNPGWHEEEIVPWVESKLQMSEDALRKILMEMQPGWQDLARRIQCPTLLVTGDVQQGVIISPAQFQEIAALNQRIREVHIPNAGHNIHRDQFEPYIQQVQGFLDEVLK